MSSELRVTFQPSGRTVYVLPNTTVFEAAARAGLILQSPCGGNGTCGKCAVRVSQGTCPASPACSAYFGPARIGLGFRLACQARMTAACVIEIPETSLFESRSKILTCGTEEALSMQPAVRKQVVNLPAPSAEDAAGDLKRLERAIGPVHAHLAALRELPGALRVCDYRGTAVICNCGADHLVAFEPGDTSATCYGIAFDLGTTTLVASLMDLVGGREISIAATMNPQVAFGDDVISRIARVRANPAALEELRQTVVDAMNTLIDQAIDGHPIERHHIYEATVAGNTTMQHLFCGISPAALGELPFPPVFNNPLYLRSADAGLRIHPNGRLYLFPNIGGFVGGDTTAGIVATGLDDTDTCSLFVDIGTNGEIVLAQGNRLLATSTAAGPAFEGARIAAGMRATDGAIEKVMLRDGDLVCNVIGNAAPAGLCGTALIDLTAELLRTGIIDTTGRILEPDELSADISPALRDRLHVRDSNVAVLLVPADQSKTANPIYLLQRDVRELQLATGAIRAGISIMLRQNDLSENDLDEVLLAGGFANFIRRDNARRIGLLPQVPTSKIRFVGNAASMGARAVLLSQDARVDAQRVAETAHHIDLSLDPEFQMEFGMAMMFPDGDL